jgi:hypothetical protein
MRPTLRRLVATSTLAGLGFTVAGCYTTSIRSGKLAQPPGIEYDQRWHHGLVWGIAELSGPYNLSRVCPRGWAVITTQTSFLNGVVSAVTSGLYSPQTVTVQCSAEGLNPLPELPGLPVSSAAP